MAHIRRVSCSWNQPAFGRISRGDVRVRHSRGFGACGAPTTRGWAAPCRRMTRFRSCPRSGSAPSRSTPRSCSRWSKPFRRAESCRRHRQTRRGVGRRQLLEKRRHRGVDEVTIHSRFVPLSRPRDERDRRDVTGENLRPLARSPVSRALAARHICLGNADPAANRAASPSRS